MAAQPKSFAPQAAAPQADPAPDIARRDERTEHPFARLRAVHDEVEETSQLANLLGRARYTGILLPVLAVAAVVLSAPPLSRVASFFALVLMGAGALLYAHAKAMQAPFDRVSLKAFAADLDAILLYTGFAWGAGAFLILPTGADPAFTTFFSGCVAASVAAILRTRDAVLMFAAPAGLLTALAAFARPLELPFTSATLAVISCLFVAGCVALSSRMKERAATTPSHIQPA